MLENAWAYNHQMIKKCLVILPTNARKYLDIQPSNVKKCLVILPTKDKLTWSCKNIHVHGHTTNKLWKIPGHTTNTCLKRLFILPTKDKLTWSSKNIHVHGHTTTKFQKIPGHTTIKCYIHPLVTLHTECKSLEVYSDLTRFITISFVQYIACENPYINKNKISIQFTLWTFRSHSKKYKLYSHFLNSISTLIRQASFILLLAS